MGMLLAHDTSIGRAGYGARGGGVRLFRGQSQPRETAMGQVKWIDEVPPGDDNDCMYLFWSFQEPEPPLSISGYL